MTLAKLPGRRRSKGFDADSNYVGDVRALLREWDLLQARYDHLPEFNQVVRRHRIKK
jgi:hypothetical protein